MAGGNSGVTLFQGGTCVIKATKMKEGPSPALEQGLLLAQFRQRPTLLLFRDPQFDAATLAALLNDEAVQANLLKPVNVVGLRELARKQADYCQVILDSTLCSQNPELRAQVEDIQRLNHRQEPCQAVAADAMRKPGM